MGRSPDVVLVGGGVAGLCTALAAADRGMDVTVIDDEQPGAASRSSAGMLGPSLPGLPESVRDLALEARDLYPEFVAGLTVRSGVDIALDRSGILEIAVSAEELHDLRARAPGAANLDQRELAELEPALGAHAGALHHAHDGWVDNHALMDALTIAADLHSRIEFLRERVTSLELSDVAAVAVLRDGRRLASRWMVLATGAWAARLPGAPIGLPVRPVKGELLTLAARSVRHVVYGPSGYLIPRGATLLVGATSEEGRFDPAPTAEGRRFLLNAAAALVPELSGARVVDHWGGLRPVSPDGLPILGVDAEYASLIHAGGFSRNGILLAPWSAQMLAQVLAEQPTAELPREFRPGRFERKQ